MNLVGVVIVSRPPPYSSHFLLLFDLTPTPHPSSPFDDDSKFELFVALFFFWGVLLFLVIDFVLGLYIVDERQ